MPSKKIYTLFIDTSEETQIIHTLIKGDSMNKYICILFFLGISSYTQTKQFESFSPTCTLTVPLSKKKSQQLPPTITFSRHSPDTLSAEEVIKQLAIGIQLRDHLCRYWPQLSLLHRIKHFIHTQKDHADQVGVIEKSQQVAREFIMLLTPKTTSDQKMLTITVSLEALKQLSSDNRKQTYETVTLITGKKFKAKKLCLKKCLS